MRAEELARRSSYALILNLLKGYEGEMTIRNAFLASKEWLRSEARFNAVVSEMVGKGLVKKTWKQTEKQYEEYLSLT